MTNTLNKILVNFRVCRETWSLFKLTCTANHSDSSKQLRKMIENYIKHNKK